MCCRPQITPSRAACGPRAASLRPLLYHIHYSVLNWEWQMQCAYHLEKLSYLLHL